MSNHSAHVPKVEGPSRPYPLGRLTALAVIISILAVFSFGVSDASARTLVTGCPPAAGKYKPKRLNVVCSASLAFDGYRINLFNITWTSWQTNLAEGSGTATYPKPFKNPKLWRNCTGLEACRPPMMKGPATVKLSNRLNCWQGPDVFRTVQVWLKGTVYAKTPWTWTYMCPPPKRELLRRGVAIRSVKRALGSYHTLWKRAFSRSVRCKRTAKHRMRCRANWNSNAVDNGAHVVVDGRAKGTVKKGLDGRTHVKMYVHVEPLGATEDHSASYWIYRVFR